MTHSILAFPVCLCVTLLLATGCTGPEVFDRIDAQESADVAEAPYPRLADVEARGPAPDPAVGDSVLIDLTIAASEAEERLKSVSGPVQ